MWAWEGSGRRADLRGRLLYVVVCGPSSLGLGVPLDKLGPVEVTHTWRGFFIVSRTVPTLGWLPLIGRLTIEIWSSQHDQPPNFVLRS